MRFQDDPAHDAGEADTPDRPVDENAPDHPVDARDTHDTRDASDASDGPGHADDADDADDDIDGDDAADDHAADDDGPPAPSPREWAALARLRSSHNWIDRVHALSDLLKGIPKVAYAVFRPPFSDHAEVDDPDLRCYLIAHELSKQLNGRVPPVLAPFLERNDLDPASRSRLESALAEHVEAWVGVPRSGRSRTLRFEFQIDGASGSDAAVSLSVRVNSQRLDDQPRTGGQLRLLLSEASREPGLIAADQLELLELLFEPIVSSCLPDNETRFVLTGSALLRVLLAAADSRLATWSPNLSPEVAERAGVAPGARLSLAAGTLEIGPVLDNTESGPRVVLQHRLPDGRVLPPDEHVVLRGRPGMRREPTLVLADGAFWTTRGDPPAPLPELFAAAGGFDPSPPRARPLVESMARAFTGLRDSLATHSRVHDVRLSVCLDLRDDDWLQLRAFASAVRAWRPGEPVDPGAAIFEWLPDGRWMSASSASLDALDAESDPRAEGDAEPAEPAVASFPAGTEDLRLVSLPDAPGAADAEPEPLPDAADPAAPGEDPVPADDVWLEFPKPERVTPVAEWLESLGAASGSRPRVGAGQPDAEDRGVGGWIRLSPRSAEHFAQAWEARPEGVAWYGNLAARGLIEAPQAVEPHLRVQASGVNWFTVSAEWNAEAAALTEADLASLRNADARFVRLASGWVRRDRAQKQDEMAELLAELGVEAGGEEQRLSVWQLAGARPEALALFDGLAGGTDAQDAVRVLREKIAAFDGLPRVPVPEAIEGTLRPYQRDGLDFLVHASSFDLGVILADDMGLGKTLQALAWLCWLIAEKPSEGPTLVVCPASVLHNWEREAARFAPHLKVLALSAGGQRHAAREQIPEHDLVLTNYALLRRDREELGAIEWRAVILDEAQNVKNPDAAVSRAARGLKAAHRLALTGTPLENRALDLWSIQAFLNPGYLGPRAQFVRRYDRADAPPHARTLLSAKLRPVMLRRLKQQVAPELPPRIEEQRDCELSTGQRKLYLAELAKGRELLAQLSEAGGVSRNKISILAVLTRLRQICCHPALVGGHADLGSGKFDALFELLEPLRAEGHKVLVFSQFVECLKLVASELESRDIGYHMLTGSSRHRGDIVADFEADPSPSPFLISLKAGGTGLNLTAANYVVLLDPWWNPAVEAQAIDRTHRIGQDRTVIAYRMVSQGTIEERIRELQSRKADLAKDLLGEDGFAKTLDRDDLDYLLADMAPDDGDDG
ncbi:MAG: hypothetical protein DHS20C15_27300 [Planctomycetota bacterium]|nr:MAG: hypothetical protein DHS20C15_27300 [Planctomycetota bacterium]